MQYCKVVLILATLSGALNYTTHIYALLLLPVHMKILKKYRNSNNKADFTTISQQYAVYEGKNSLLKKIMLPPTDRHNMA